MPRCEAYAPLLSCMQKSCDFGNIESRGEITLKSQKVKESTYSVLHVDIEIMTPPQLTPCHIWQILVSPQGSPASTSCLHFHPFFTHSGASCISGPGYNQE